MICEYRYVIIRILMVVVSLMGCHALGYAQKADCDAVIDSLLYQHDLCERGVVLPDSAIYFTVAALQLAESCYGMDSEEYSDLFTDYFMSDVSRNKDMILNELYSTITQLFDPASSFGWRPFYKLGNLLEMHGESEKAAAIYNIVISSAISTYGRIRAGMELAKIRQREDGSDLEQSYSQYMNDIACLEFPEKENVLIELAIDLADYFLSIKDYARALEYISNGERLTGHVSAHKTMRLLRKKYEYLLKYSHLEAVKCLDYAIDLVSRQDAAQDDKDWIAVALIDRGDYAWNELCNTSQACSYYIKAFKLTYSPKMNCNSKTMCMILRRLVHLLTLCGDYDEAIQLGELYFEASNKAGVGEASLFIALDLMDAYLRKGDIQKAAEKFEDFKEVLYSDVSMYEKAHLVECKILMAQQNYMAASERLRSLLNKAKRRDIRIWAQRLLASAYSYLGDDRLGAISDSINQATKEFIGSQFWFISPLERKNWLDFCEEAVCHQLSLEGSEHAIKNAAELNLFRKSLLFRTDSQIGEIISRNPSASVLVDSLSQLRRVCVEAMNKGDRETVRTTNLKIDSLRQVMTNKFVDVNLLIKDIDSNLDDVLKNLGDDDVAIDFLSNSSGNSNEIGAFIYSHKFPPRYISLITDPATDLTDYAVIIWNHLKSEIKNHSEVFFCADGILHTLPIEFAKKTTDIEGKVRLHRVFHLSKIEADQTIGDNWAFIGVSDYPAHESVSETHEGFASLNGPSIELRSLQNNIPSPSARVLLDNEATEENIRKLDNLDINTLHFSTHGTFRSHDNLVNAKDSLSDIMKILVSHWLSVSDGPLSGLILSSAEKGDNLHHDNKAADGLLTAEEIELMKFPNLNLTVLSACDTGLGEIDSEGVWGLQRAFRIAGTKNLICSLNKVDDYWTAQFMDAFYEKAASGNNIYDSFHSAQRWLRQELPDNPEIWSSFILIE